MRIETKHSQNWPWCRLGALAAILAAIPMFSACYVGVREPIHEVDITGPREDIYASEAPPAPQAEAVIGVAPSPEYVWVGGYWTRHREGWYWVGGRWAVRPRPGAVWVSGRWANHPRGYVWVGGHWR